MLRTRAKSSRCSRLVGLSEWLGAIHAPSLSCPQYLAATRWQRPHLAAMSARAPAGATRPVQSVTDPPTQGCGLRPRRVRLRWPRCSAAAWRGGSSLSTAIRPARSRPPQPAVAAVCRILWVESGVRRLLRVLQPSVQPSYPKPLPPPPSHSGPVWRAGGLDGRAGSGRWRRRSAARTVTRPLPPLPRRMVTNP